MVQLGLHHVAVVVTDLPRSMAFYQTCSVHNYRATAFQDRRCLARLQVHLILYPIGSFRAGNIDINDGHFAFRTDDL